MKRFWRWGGGKGEWMEREGKSMDVVLDGGMQEEGERWRWIEGGG